MGIGAEGWGLRAEAEEQDEDQSITGLRLPNSKEIQVISQVGMQPKQQQLLPEETLKRCNDRRHMFKVRSLRDCQRRPNKTVGG